MKFCEIKLMVKSYQTYLSEIKILFLLTASYVLNLFSQSLNGAGCRCSASHWHSIALGYAYGLKAFKPSLNGLSLFFIAPAESFFQLWIHDRILFRQYWRWLLSRGAESVTVQCAKCSSEAVFEHFCLENWSCWSRRCIHFERWRQLPALQGGCPVWAWFCDRVLGPYGDSSLMSSNDWRGPSKAGFQASETMLW